MPVETLNLLSAIFTIALQVAIVGLVIGWILARSGTGPSYLSHVARYAYELAFGASLAATLGSLYYSEVIGYVPCGLCWWQRIFMYPQTILLGIALWKRERQAAIYSMIFSVLGGAIGLYHYALEWGGEGFLPCPATGVSCAARLVFEFGYISLPLMSVSIFTFIYIVLAIRTNIHREAVAD